MQLHRGGTFVDMEDRHNASKAAESAYRQARLKLADMLQAVFIT